MATKIKDLTQGNIRKTIIHMTIPMIFGMLGIVAFNFADTAYVGQLGSVQLAALSFTFPVIMIVQSVSHGLGIGAGSVIARSVLNKQQVKRLATDGLILSFIVVVIVVTVGVLTIEPLFTMLGAMGDVMVYIKQYMTIWYFGVPMVVIPIVGNNIIRALGDTKTPGIVMMITAGLNIIIDPILIFGWWGFPKMGVVGAAVATVIARFLSLVVALYILGRRERLLTVKDISAAKVLRSFGRILHVGIPSTLTKAIVPFGTAIVTALLAVYGDNVVAGYGAGVKTEFVIVSVVAALATVIISFTGQNYGAGNIERMRAGFKFACGVNVVYSVLIYGVLFFVAPYIAPLFNQDVLIQQTIVLYLRIAVAGLAFQGGVLIVTSAYNAVGKPLHAAFLSLLQMFALYIPLALLLSRYMKQSGIFVALVISNLVASVIGYILFMRFLKKEDIKRQTMDIVDGYREAQLSDSKKH